MKIIFGLGNPGLRYATTRHNCGFLVLDQIAAALGCQFAKSEHDNLTATGFWHGEKIMLAKPQSYMNLSGYPYVRLCDYYKVDYQDTLIIFDDLSLQPGQLRFRRNGSDGGHNGMKSIILQSGSKDVNRLKVGIGAAPYDTAVYVTSPFGKEEMPLFADTFKLAADAALCWAEKGISCAMNEYNHSGSAKKDKPAKEIATEAESAEK